MSARIAVVGGGISGLSTALALCDADPTAEVTLVEAGSRLGGLIATTPFAGLNIDEGADAFLARTPEAVDLARRVGLGEELVSPEPVGAAVWYDGLHPIPDGLVLGLPGRPWPLASSGLLSWRGKLRAAIEPLLPRTSVDADSIGAFVRARFGDEVHERLVDALVGSIYAADTDRFSLAEVPQLSALAADRSVLLAARRRAGAAATGSPIFATPRSGMGALVDACADALVAAGATICTATPVVGLAETGAGRWRLETDTSASPEPVDAVVLACPPRASGRLLAPVAPRAAALLAAAESADVVMVTIHVGEWPQRLRGLSGYLVPKPVQRHVTAVSFGSQKWAHWRPPGGGEILRVSLGRDGAPVLGLDDTEVVTAALDDLERHLGVRLEPLETRITRWPGAFAQYRPHHRAWVDDVEHALPEGIEIAGAGYLGIGIPACIRSGPRAAGRTCDRLRDLEESSP